MRRIGLFFCLCMLSFASARAEAQTLNSALRQGEVIRLHVIAHSDTAEDQAVKLLVRDALLEQFAPLLACASFDEAEEMLAALLPDIERCARARALEAGFDGEVVALFEMRDFPTREYDGVRVPAGRYPALCVELGEAAGRNWWCVMYPPLCLSTATLADAEQAAIEGVQFDSLIVRLLKRWGWVR